MGQRFHCTLRRYNSFRSKSVLALCRSACTVLTSSWVIVGSTRTILSKPPRKMSVISDMTPCNDQVDDYHIYIYIYTYEILPVALSNQLKHDNYYAFTRGQSSNGRLSRGHTRDVQNRLLFNA